MSRRTFLLAGLVPAALAAATLAGRPVGLGVALIALALVGVAVARDPHPRRLAGLLLGGRRRARA